MSVGTSKNGSLVKRVVEMEIMSRKPCCKLWWPSPAHVVSQAYFGRTTGQRCWLPPAGPLPVSGAVVALQSAGRLSGSGARLRWSAVLSKSACSSRNRSSASCVSACCNTVYVNPLRGLQLVLWSPKVQQSTNWWQRNLISRTRKSNSSSKSTLYYHGLYEKRKTTIFMTVRQEKLVLMEPRHCCLLFFEENM